MKDMTKTFGCIICLLTLIGLMEVILTFHGAGMPRVLPMAFLAISPFGTARWLRSLGVK